MPKLSQRNIVLAVMIAYAVLSMVLAAATVGVLPMEVVISTVIGGLIFGSLAFAYWRGWEPARLITLIATTILAGLTIQAPMEFLPAEALILPMLGLILGGPAWVVGVAIAQILMLVVRAYLAGGPDGMGTYGTAGGLILYVMGVVVLLLSRLMLERALQTAQENARRADAARAEAEAQAQELAQQAEDLARRNEDQRRLLDLVSALETPAVSLADGVLLAPVVGTLDSRRATDLTSRLLHEASARRARHIVIDIAGVVGVDTAVARSLLQTTQALRLLGCHVTLTGISAVVASTLTDLGINLDDVHVARSPQDVLGIGAAARLS